MTNGLAEILAKTVILVFNEEEHALPVKAVELYSNFLNFVRPELVILIHAC